MGLKESPRRSLGSPFLGGIWAKIRCPKGILKGVLGGSWGPQKILKKSGFFGSRDLKFGLPKRGSRRAPEVEKRGQNF